MSRISKASNGILPNGQLRKINLKGKMNHSLISNYFLNTHISRKIVAPLLILSCLLLSACPGPKEQNLGSREDMLTQQVIAEKEKVIRDSTQQCKNTIEAIRSHYHILIKGGTCRIRQTNRINRCLRPKKDAGTAQRAGRSGY